MKENATRRRSQGSGRKTRRRPEPTTEAPTDVETNTQLLSRLNRGDRSAWIDLLDRYERLIYAVPRRCGLSAEDAADVFQDVLHAFLKGLPRIRNAEGLPAWFLRTAFRLTMRRRKAMRRQIRPEKDAFWAEVPDAAPDPERSLEQLEAVASVQEAMGHLDTTCRRLLTALFLDEPRVSYTQMSQRLGLPMGSLGPTRRRCLDQLLGALSKKPIKERPRVTYPVESRVSKARSRRRS